jgi:hypothetical protein
VRFVYKCLGRVKEWSIFIPRPAVVLSRPARTRQERNDLFVDGKKEREKE